MVQITAVVPTFDRHNLLPIALRSIAEQADPPNEIVVIDNGYSPVPAHLVPAPARLVRISPGVGFGAAMNAGVAQASCEYVSFLDDDDRWTSSYLLEVRRAIASHAGSPDVVLANKHRELQGVIEPYKMITSLDGLRSQLLYKNPGVAAQNLTVSRNFHTNVHPGFRSELHSSADRAYLIDAIDRGAEICLAPKAVVVKVFHPGVQMTDRNEIRKVIRFCRVYWPTMGRRERLRNVRRVVRALPKLLAKGVK